MLASQAPVGPIHSTNTRVHDTHFCGLLRTFSVIEDLQDTIPLRIDTCRQWQLWACLIILVAPGAFIPSGVWILGIVLAQFSDIRAFRIHEVKADLRNSG